jgi:hypothetical protein
LQGTAVSSSGNIFGNAFYADLGINAGYHIGSGKPALSITPGGTLNLGAAHPSHIAAGVSIFTTGSDFSKGLFLDSTGNITASGNISASGTVTAENIAVAADLTVTGNIIGASRKYELPSSTVGDFKGGDIYYYGDGSTVKGGIYYINGTNWTLADADAEASTAGLLAVALGTDPDVDGMLLRGFVTLLTEVEGTEAIGSVLYLSATDSGKATVTVPGSGNFVRVLGYSLHATENQVYFNPGSTWVEVA